MSNPVIQSTIDRIVVLFGDVPHLSIARDRLLGFQSWHEYDKSKFTIEWTCEGGVIVTEYDDAEKWTSILQQVNAILSRDALRNANRGAGE
jgi:hypothetical protein